MDTKQDTDAIQCNTENTSPSTEQNSCISTPDTLQDRILQRRKSGQTIRAIALAENTSICKVQRTLDKAVSKTVQELGFTVSPQRIKDMIYAHAPKAVRTIAECMDSKKDDTKLKASQDVLERAGIGTKPDTVVNVDARSVTHNWSASPELIDAITSIKCMYSKLLSQDNRQLVDRNRQDKVEVGIPLPPLPLPDPLPQKNNFSKGD
jgi:hypothetical protein